MGSTVGEGVGKDLAACKIIYVEHFAVFELTDNENEHVLEVCLH